MTNLSHRSNKKEFLDQEDIPFADVTQVMKELNRVNGLLGGHKISINGINELMPVNPGEKPLVVCEIGSGGGDNLTAIYNAYLRKKMRLNFIGIDIKQSCIDFAAEQNPLLPVTWISSDYSKVDFGEHKPDIIFSSLFCHHFTDEELVRMLKWMRENSGRGFFINDLQRSPVAYHLIKWLTRFFSKSNLVKNDAPLSVARAFKKKEWQRLFSIAGIHNYNITWKWAFRYLIVYKNEQ